MELQPARWTKVSFSATVVWITLSPRLVPGYRDDATNMVIRGGECYRAVSLTRGVSDARHINPRPQR